MGDSKFFGVSAAFDSFSNDGKELIVQYQAKYEKDVECGGGYLKIGPKMEDQTKFGDPTVYNIMFGPDKCGYTKRTHLIFNYKGKNVLKKTDLAYKQEVLKPKTIADPEDKKPSDWVEEAMMDDPTEKKPDDWVEEKRIVDPEAKKPDDWDDDEDGEWEPPMKDNPAFKGEWIAKRISNPAYKGFWEAKKIDNPEYEDDDSVYKYPDFGFIGFDLWQVKGGTIFDNVIVCDDKAEADAFAAKWKAISEVEKAEKKKADDTKKDEEKKKEDEDDDDDDDEEDKKESEEM